MARKASKKNVVPRRAVSRSSSPMIEEVRQLVQLMVDHELSEVDITDGHRKILLKRGPAGVAAATVPTAAPAAVAPAAPAAVAAPQPAATGEAAADKAPAEEFTEIKSPMVGTYYTAPSPDTDPYVRPGDVVDAETVVCIVEAMKVMNEVRAECAGTIVEICVKNAQPVEYGQALFRVRPD